MSDKPETEDHSKGAVRKRTLSFDEVMSGASPEPKPPPKAEPPPAPKKSAQPTFEEILARSAPPPEGAPQSRPPGDRGKPSRPPRQPQRQKDDRKPAVVVQRKPVLGATSMPPPVEMAPAADADAGAEARQAEEPASPATGGARRRGASEAVPESVYAQPGADEGSDFAALFAESGSQQKQGKLRVGQRVTARIAHLGGEVAFLDLGGKGEGLIDLGELRNEKGEVQANIGETIEGYVLSVGDGVVVTKSVPKGAGREIVQSALDSKIPIEGVVTGQNKGGLEVDLGGLRGFVPTSQVDVRFVEDLSQFVGQKLKFRVTELRGGNAILSRRSLLEEERAAQAKELRSKLTVGAQLDGVITSVRDFGAFVDLGGVEGLVHVSELSHARVAHAQDAVMQGQKVKVQILRIEPPGKDGEKGQERIALSLRALEQDPWDAARSQIKEGMRLTGKVARLQPFGAFVELFPGVDGLVHVSALADRHIQHPRDVVKEGESILVQVESIDDDSRRIALRKVNEGDPVEKPAAAGASPAAAAGGKKAKVGDSFEVTVDKVEAFGVFVRWDGGKGLIPNSELGTPRGSDNKKTMPVGTKTKASIVEIDDRGRYRLSRTSAERAAEGSDYRDYQREMNRKLAPGKGFGTLGDLLRAKLAPAEEDE